MKNGISYSSIVKLIRSKTDAKLIFVTTTYVPDYEAGRYKEDVIKYNEIAKRIMEANNVRINDMYEKSMWIHKAFGKDTTDVHYLPEGYKELGLQISDFLLHELDIRTHARINQQGQNQI